MLKAIVRGAAAEGAENESPAASGALGERPAAAGSIPSRLTSRPGRVSREAARVVHVKLYISGIRGARAAATLRPI